MSKHLSIVFLITIFSSLSACVSLDMQPEIESSESLYFQVPSSNFKKRDTENLDGHFVESETGNSISVKSSCFDPADPSLNVLESSAFGGMTVIKVLEKTNKKFSKREALHSKKLVRIDGIPVVVEMLILKKNSCNYLISHVGVQDSFKKTSNDFSEFLDKMRIP